MRACADVVVIVGPQAAGKSTVSAALAADLRLRGETVALVELDEIAGMALPTLPGWDVALEIFSSVTAQWTVAGFTCVIAEGIGSSVEVARVRAVVPSDAALLTIAVTTSLPSAFKRAQADPTRGVSKEYSFLAEAYDTWSSEVHRLAADVTIDSEAVSVQEAVSRIGDALDEVRASREHSRVFKAGR